MGHLYHGYVSHNQMVTQTLTNQPIAFWPLTPKAPLQPLLDLSEHSEHGSPAALRARIYNPEDFKHPLVLKHSVISCKYQYIDKNPTVNIV